ncbi:MAG TPA: hypothetical protein VNL94_00145 [Candidatus Binatia bacterium]|nr:hypothetical protein [Candidatus Binatia bacterium]
MSLHTIVSEGLSDRIQQLRAARATVAPPPIRDLALRLPGASMRALETTLAVVAIAAALLLGLGR